MATRLLNEMKEAAEHIASKQKEVVPLRSPGFAHSPAVLKKERLDPVNSVSVSAASSWRVDFEISTVDETWMDACLLITVPSLSNATHEYISHLAINAIEHLKMSHGGRTLHDFDMGPVAAYLLRQIRENQSTHLLKMSGDLTAVVGDEGGTFLSIPLPLFFSSFWFGAEGISLKDLSGKIKLELTMRPAGECVIATGGTSPYGFTTANPFLICWHRQHRELTTEQLANPSLYKIDTYDWTTLSAAAVADATDVELSFNNMEGDCALVGASVVTDANVALSDYITQAVVTKSKLKFKNEDFVDNTQLVSQNEVAMDAYMRGGFEQLKDTAGTDMGDMAAIITPNVPVDIKSRDWHSSINFVNKPSVQFTVRTSSGASQAYPFSLQHAIYTFASGKWQRTLA